LLKNFHAFIHLVDYLADKEDYLRDSTYHTRLWWEYLNKKELSCPLPVPDIDEESRRRGEEESRRLDERCRAIIYRSEYIKSRCLPPDSEEGQRYNIYTILTRPISDEERKDFESKFERCASGV